MAVERKTLADFSGGMWPKRAASDFTDRQWAKVRGFVFEDEQIMRTQWAWQPIGTETGFDELGVAGQLLIGRKPDGTFWWCEYPRAQWSSTTLAALSWTQLTSITADTALHIAGPIVMRDVDSAGFVQGLLLNGVGRSGSAFAVWEDRSTFDANVKEWSTKWPASGGTDDCMPPADKAVMWGDFLVLGSIRWFDDDTAALADLNNKLFENGLWFSAGGDTDNFDPLDVEFVNLSSTVAAGDDYIEGMVPIDAGMMVVTTGGVALLRGAADDHALESLRASIGPNENAAPCWWPHAGSTILMDKAGQLWSTNSEEFLRLDTGLDLSRSTLSNEDHVWGWHDNLLWSRDGELWCFHAFDVEGVWSQIITPGDGVTQMVNLGDQLYGIEQTGGRVWRWNRLDLHDDYSDPSTGVSERGQIDGTAVSPSVASRTLELHPHRKTMWQRIGVRARGGYNTATLDAVRMFPRAFVDGGSSFDKAPAEAVGDRYEYVCRAPGPTKELSVEVEFTGDVELEAVSLWHHQGHDDR